METELPGPIRSSPGQMIASNETKKNDSADPTRLSKIRQNRDPTSPDTRYYPTRG